MKTIYAALIAVTLFTVACGGSTTTTTDGGNVVVDAGVKLDTQDHILTYLTGKTIVMEGANIPSDPNGYNANVYYGAGSQCYKKVNLTFSATGTEVTAQLGAVKPTDGGVFVAADVGKTGVCDTSSTTPYDSMPSSTLTLTNIKNNGECFDFNVSYTSLAQTGRGSLVGQTLKLELFVGNAGTVAYTGINCADGNPGAATVKKAGNAYTGNAVQTYVVSQ
jgi:hypothetical protein